MLTFFKNKFSRILPETSIKSQKPLKIRLLPQKGKEITHFLSFHFSGVKMLASGSSFPKWLVKNGDESHGIRIRKKKSPTP